MDGNRLKDIRLKAGHTQESLSELLGVGIRQIWRYEKNETEPSGEMVARLARALNTSADYLLGLTDDPAPGQIEELSPKERAAVAAWRRGDVREAIRAIVNE
jgi:transcriptional regulator with XRE-family HTH domain